MKLEKLSLTKLTDYGDVGLISRDKKNNLNEKIKDQFISNQNDKNKELSNSKVLGNSLAALGGEIGRFPLSFSLGSLVSTLVFGTNPIIAAAVGLFFTLVDILPDLTYFEGLFAPIAKMLGVINKEGNIDEEKANKLMDHIGKISIGKMLGLVIGGILGYSVGKILDFFNIKLPYPDRLVNETKSFELKNLFKNLGKITYTSRKKITEDELREIMKNLKPGDIIINEIEDYTLINLVASLNTRKVMQWGHAMIYLGEGKVMEARMETNSVTENDFITSNEGYTHLIVIRPPEELTKKIVEEAMKFKDKVKYDYKYDLSTDDAMYCSEFVYKVLKNADPNIKIFVRKTLTGSSALYPDEIVEIPKNNLEWKVVFLTDENNLFYNILSKYR